MKLLMKITSLLLCRNWSDRNSSLLPVALSLFVQPVNWLDPRNGTLKWSNKKRLKKKKKLLPTNIFLMTSFLWINMSWRHLDVYPPVMVGNVHQIDTMEVLYLMAPPRTLFVLKSSVIGWSGNHCFQGSIWVVNLGIDLCWGLTLPKWQRSFHHQLVLGRLYR